jgi:hypothetical protein
MRDRFLLAFLGVSLTCVASGNACADDGFVTAAKSLTARAFDKTLPEQPVESWLRAHLPAGYQIVWGEEVTDCGEGGGGPIEGRDMPLCAEVVVKSEGKMVGYLALVVGTHKRGLLKGGYELYFGYLERTGVRHDLKHLRDLLKQK